MDSNENADLVITVDTLEILKLCYLECGCVSMN